jgi:hypothetical protein
MIMRVIAVLVVLACLALAGGCSRRGDGPESGKAVGSRAEAGDAATSDAARSRGVAADTAAGGGEKTPRIELGDVVYEWRVQPEKGLHVIVDLTNPVQSDDRARGYMFLMAASSADPSIRGVYPWNAVLEGETPKDVKSGTHLLYRVSDQVRAFIPYKKSTGYYDTLTILIYSEEGDVVTNQTYPLEVTGESTGPKKPAPALVL